jgi:hypothetical protein
MRTEENNMSAERRLDAALKRYGDAEPRPGLENRVLANLHAEEARLAISPMWWRPVAAALTIAVLTGGALLLRQKPDIAGIPISSQAASVSRDQEPQLAAAPASRPHGASRQPRRSRSYSHSAQPSSSEPRLEQFPAPTPLSEQEEMLARYVRLHRQEAILVARARAELLKQELERFTQQSPSKLTNDLEQ